MDVRQSGHVIYDWDRASPIPIHSETLGAKRFLGSERRSMVSTYYISMETVVTALNESGNDVLYVGGVPISIKALMLADWRARVIAKSAGRSRVIFSGPDGKSTISFKVKTTQKMAVSEILKRLSGPGVLAYDALVGNLDPRPFLGSFSDQELLDAVQLRISKRLKPRKITPREAERVRKFVVRYDLSEIMSEKMESIDSVYV